MNCVSKKNLKTLLIMAPQWDICQPPLGIAYVAAMLREKGFLVEQRDLSIELFHALPQEKKYIMESAYYMDWTKDFNNVIYPQIRKHVDQWIQEIVSHDAQVIGFSVFAINKAVTIHMIERIKERCPGKIIVVGGPQVTRHEEDDDIIKNSSIDFIVTDEGEETFCELISVIEQERNISQVKGVIYRSGDKMIDNGPRTLIASLDSLPFPSFVDFPLDYYKDVTLPILTSRGCVNRCSFCSEHVFWKKFRFRTGRNIYEEFKFQNEKFGKNNFYIVDSLINGNIRELASLCDLLIQDKEMNVYWGGKATIRREMTGGLLKKMSQAGNMSLVYGLESGSEKVLKDMRKRNDIELAKKIFKETWEAGIKVGVFWIIGFPTEDEKDFQKSIDFLREIKDYVDVVTPGRGCGILKGSELQIEHKRFGITFKDDGWYSLHTTPLLRGKRLKRFKEECRALGVRMDE